MPITSDARKSWSDAWTCADAQTVKKSFYCLSIHPQPLLNSLTWNRIRMETHCCSSLSVSMLATDLAMDLRRYFSMPSAWDDVSGMETRCMGRETSLTPPVSTHHRCHRFHLPPSLALNQTHTLQSVAHLKCGVAICGSDFVSICMYRWIFETAHFCIKIDELEVYTMRQLKVYTMRHGQPCVKQWSNCQSKETGQTSNYLDSRSRLWSIALFWCLPKAPGVSGGQLCRRLFHQSCWGTESQAESD